MVLYDGQPTPLRTCRSLRTMRDPLGVRGVNGEVESCQGPEQRVRGEPPQRSPQFTHTLWKTHLVVLE